MMRRIGVLALQGGYKAHSHALREIGHEPIEIREAGQLESIEGLIFPGGESTSQLKLINRFALREPLNRFAQTRYPILATCAGLVLLARQVLNPIQTNLGWLDVTIERNAWGRQLHSFEATADESNLPLCFIRAPRIITLAPHVTILIRYQNEPVMIQQDHITAATFHPELTANRHIHRSIFGCSL